MFLSRDGAHLLLTACEILSSAIVVFVAYILIMKNRTVSSGFSARSVGTATPSGRIGERSNHEQFEQVKRTALLQQKVAALESEVTALRNERGMVLPRDTGALHRQDNTGLPVQLSEADMQVQRKQEEDRIFFANRP